MICIRKESMREYIGIFKSFQLCMHCEEVW